MISSRQDYRYYREQDRIALGGRSHPRLIGDEIWKYQIRLRRAEYSDRCCRSFWQLPYRLFSRYLFHRSSVRLGFSIPLHVFREGLSIAHYGCLVVNSNAKIGKNCRIQEGVTIGATGGSDSAPRIGDNVFIGSGARLIGNITIADRIVIGAGSVVVSSFDTPGITIAGVPARQISSHSSDPFLAPGLRDQQKPQAAKTENR